MAMVMVAVRLRQRKRPDRHAARDLARGARVEDDGRRGVVAVVGGGGGVVGEVGAGRGGVAEEGGGALLDEGGVLVLVVGGCGFDDAGAEAWAGGARGDVEGCGAFVDFCAVLDAFFDYGWGAGAGGDEVDFGCGKGGWLVMRGLVLRGEGGGYFSCICC